MDNKTWDLTVNDGIGKNALDCKYLFCHYPALSLTILSPVTVNGNRSSS